MDAVEKANSGHPGLPMGCADIATVLFTKVMKFDPADPWWPDRDRFILSAGHGSMLLYSSLYLLGYEDMTIDQIKQFRQLGAKTAGHPEYHFAAGIETTTGPLGQGIANSVGFAIAEAKLARRVRFRPRRPHDLGAGRRRLPDGRHQPGSHLARRAPQAQQALSSSGTTTTSPSTAPCRTPTRPTRSPASRPAAGTPSRSTATTSTRSRRRVAAKASDRPTLVAAKTTIGFGAPKKAGSHAVHGSPLGAEDSEGRQGEARHHLPRLRDSRRNAERLAGRRHPLGQRPRRLGRSPRRRPADRRAEFERRLKGELPANWADHRRLQVEARRRQAQGRLAQGQPDGARGDQQGAARDHRRLGRSHRLQPHQHAETLPFTAADRTGRYMRYGIREHEMAAAMNGIALHKGFIPYGGTFLVFTDYARPAIRLSAIMGRRSST
jgi:transketolase